MARAAVTHEVTGVVAEQGRSRIIALPSATVYVYEQGTSTPIAQTMWNAVTAGTAQTNPLTADSTGVIQFWLDTPQYVDLVKSAAGFAARRETVEADVPGGSGIAINQAGGSVAVDTSGAVTLTPASGQIVALGTGDEPAINGGTVFAPQLMRVLKGTSGAPITTMGSLVKLARTIAVTGATAGGEGSDGLSTLHVQAEGTAACQVQPIAVFGYANNVGTVNGGSGALADACGVYGKANINAGGIGNAIGGFFLGGRRGTNSAAGARALDVVVTNAGTTSNHAYNANGTEQTIGIFLNAFTGSRVAAGMVLGNAWSTLFDTGYAAAQNSVFQTAFRDDSSAVTSFLVTGTHTNGIDLTGGTFTGAAIKTAAGALNGFGASTPTSPVHVLVNTNLTPI